MSRYHYYKRRHRVPLARNPDRARIAGICAGVARYFNIEPWIIRVITVVALLLRPEAILLAYGLGYLILDQVHDDEIDPDPQPQRRYRDDSEEDPDDFD